MTESGDEPIRLGERYELGGLLGRGGMADVRVGRDLRLGRTVAVKQLRSDLASDPTFQERFRREAQSAASLNHPSIVAVYDTGEAAIDSGQTIPYIVMEYVEGQTLRDILRDGRKILPERALSITADILSALDYSHRSGIIHRDIKPANVMLTPGGQVKVMDFGIARAIADASSGMTQTASVIGTAQYLSPEQARGETVDARSDIYSTGCLLYELLTGRPPFVGDSPVSVAYQHVREEPQLPSQFNSDVTPAIDQVVARSLTKRTDDRYQSAADMRRDIERVIQGQPVQAPTAATQAMGTQAMAAVPHADDTEEQPAETDEEKPKKKKAKWWLIGILIALLLAGIAFGIYKLMQPPPVEQVEVPKVVGMDFDEAKRALTNEGFKVADPEETPSGKVDEGKVISQDPGAGQTADENSTVTLTVSTGPKEVEMPDVRGLDADVAEGQLTGNQYQFNVQLKKTDDSAPKNQVVNSTPLPGATTTVGSKVTLYVSKGQVTVPNVVGMDEKDAEKALDEAGVKYRKAEQETDSANDGEIIEQSVSGGQSISPDKEVVITVARKPDDGDGDGGDGGGSDGGDNSDGGNEGDSASHRRLPFDPGDMGEMSR